MVAGAAVPTACFMSLIIACKWMVHSADSLCSVLEQSLSLHSLSELSETFPFKAAESFSSCWVLLGQTGGALQLAQPCNSIVVQASRSSPCERRRV